MKVVVASLFGGGFEERLTEEFPEVDFVFAASEEDQTVEIKDADVFMGSPSRDVFLASDRLRWLHCPGHRHRQAVLDTGDHKQRRSSDEMPAVRMRLRWPITSCRCASRSRTGPMI